MIATEIDIAEPTANPSAVIKQNVIERTCAQRDAALAKFGQAFELLAEAQELVPTVDRDFRLSISGIETWRMKTSDTMLEDTRKAVDAAAWRVLINDHGFERLMDRKARQEFYETIHDNPPPLTAEIAHDTLLGLLEDSHMLFLRGLALAFSTLDRRFRSHDGFKIGSRIVLSYAFDGQWGGWNHYRHHDDTLRDIERVFCQLLKRPFPDRENSVSQQLVGAQRAARNSNQWPCTVETDYFRARIFKNGNCHLWFTDDELVRRCNLLLAEYYGENVLGYGPDAKGNAGHAGANPLDNPTRTLAKNCGFFPTPPEIIERMLDLVPAPHWDEPFTVLEPSAGEGAIAKVVRERYPKAIIECVEIDEARHMKLACAGFLTTWGDFLSWPADAPDIGRFDRIYMNPPFDGQRDIDHVAHAAKFLAPAGKLCAVMSAGVEFRENAKAVAFRELIAQMGGKITDLPAGSFAEVGTNVNTCLVTLTRKD